MSMRLAVALIVTALVCSVRTEAQAPTAAELLGRGADYVKRFVAEFSNVVAEEEFRQEWVGGARRRLKSDFLLVRYPGAQTVWLAFRDVFDVDGRAVRDQQDRLTKLFLEPFDDAMRRAEEITRAGSRHSLVELSTLSNPLLILVFLQPHYQPDFIFRLGRTDRKLGPTVRALELEERVLPAPTNLQGPRPPLLGVAWLEEDTGRVVKTELRVGVAPNTRIVVTTFTFDRALGINVPEEMREWRVGPTSPAPNRGLLNAGATFTGVATYGRFRRFEVRTDETIGEPAVKP